MLVMPVAAQEDQRCFAETGFCMTGRIRSFWEEHGGLPVFGLPITAQQPEQIEGRTVHVQWFERARLELHRDYAAPFDVLLGRIGAELLAQQGRDWYTFPRGEPDPSCHFSPETGHTICGAFLETWRANGLELDGQPGKTIEESQALFGLPLSSEQTETLSDGTTYLVQWFERARFEYHPEQQPSFRVLLGLLGNELHGIASAATPLPPPRRAHFEPFVCPFHHADLAITCGHLVVPANRDNPHSARIRVAVSIVHAPAPNPAEPLIYLSGGPGSSALDHTVVFSQAWASFIGNRDIMFIDQRGTGYSQPSLTCPESIEVDDRLLMYGSTRAERARAESEAALRCHERWNAEGVHCTDYHSAASAADIHDLLAVLGYDQATLFGISYGTRLALTMMRDYPESVRAAVLDSVYPPHVNLYAGMPEYINRTFSLIFNACAAQPPCRTAYPNLEQMFARVVAQLDASPVTIQITNLRAGQPMPLVVDGGGFTEVVFHISYVTDQIPVMPMLIANTLHGDYRLLAEFQELRLRRKWPGLSIGMYYAVQCNEEIPFTPLDKIHASSAPYPMLRPFFDGVIEHTTHIYDLCDAFGVHSPDPREQEPVASHIPTLLLAGEYDPITPPIWAHQAAQSLQTAFVYEFPGTGHAVIARGACPANIIRAFLHNPTTAPDGSCTGWFGAPIFVR